MWLFSWVYCAFYLFFIFADFLKVIFFKLKYNCIISPPPFLPLNLPMHPSFGLFQINGLYLLTVNKYILPSFVRTATTISVWSWFVILMSRCLSSKNTNNLPGKTCQRVQYWHQCYMITHKYMLIEFEACFMRWNPCLAPSMRPRICG